MNLLNTPKRVQVIAALLDRSSINAIVHMTGVAKHTILKLLLENHGHAVAFHFMHYNFCRIHKTLRVTPAMEAGIADHVWSIEEIVSLLEVSKMEAA